MKKKLCVVGVGYWGKNILRNLKELSFLSGIYDADPKNPILAEYRKETKIYNSFDDVLNDKEIDGVVISTPSITHFELVKKSLLGGKDVFVEKPLALTVKEGEELVNLSNEKNKILMVGHILQYHPALIKLKELISKDMIGKVQYIYSNRLNIGKLRTEENILWSFAPHDISVILMLLDEEPVNVNCFGGDYLNKGIYDTTLTTLEFKNGVKGHVFVSWLHPYKEQKLIIVGSKAMIVFDDMSEEKLFLYPHKIDWKDGKIPVAKKAMYEVIPVEKKEPLKEEIKHFVECITSRKIPKTDGNEGLCVLRILEAAERSLKKQN